MEERFSLEGSSTSDQIEDMNHQQVTPEETVSESKWDYWHTGLWRIDMDKPSEQDIELEPVRIYKAPFSEIPFHIRFAEQLSDEELTKYLQALVSWIDEGGLDAIRAHR
jgi:hypothetical protein